jgi:hypothetical protein
MSLMVRAGHDPCAEARRAVAASTSEAAAEASVVRRVAMVMVYLLG